MRTLVVIWQTARGEPVRSLLSALALTLGMLGLVSVVAASAVLGETVQQRALFGGGPSTTVRVLVGGLQSAEELRSYGDFLAARSAASAVAAEVWIPEAGLRSARGDALVDLVFVDDAYLKIFPLALVSGNWGTGLSGVAPRVVVNDRAAEVLRGERRAELSLVADRTGVHVSGELRDGAPIPRIYVPIAEPLWTAQRSARTYIVLSGPTLTTDSVSRAARELASFGVPGAADEVERIDTVGQLAEELAATSRVLLALGGLSVASTLLGAVNLGLATSRARAREFSLRRVFGASRVQIALVTLGESQLIACVSAVIAYGCSWALFPVILEAFDIPAGVAAPDFSPAIGAVSFGVSAGAALAASIVPAVSSSRRDLSSVMRY